MAKGAQIIDERGFSRSASRAGDGQRGGSLRPRLAVELVSHLASIEAEVLCVGHHGEAALQRKALATYSDPDGGFFLTEAMAAAIERTVGAMTALPGLAQTLVGHAAVYKKPVRTTGVSYAWRGEGKNPGSTSTPTFSLLTFEAREVDAFPEVTNESLEDLGFDVEALLTDEVALAFAHAEADALLTGDGLARPRGLLRCRIPNSASSLPPGRIQPLRDRFTSNVRYGPG